MTKKQYIKASGLYYRVLKNLYIWIHLQEQPTEKTEEWLKKQLEAHIKGYKDEFNIKKLSKRKLKWFKNKITKES
jgi:hypothetical protein